MVSLLAADRAAAERSLRDGAAPALMRILAPDGAVLWPGAPVVAETDAVRSLFSAIRLGSAALTWEPLGAELSADSTLGLTWGASMRVSRESASGPSPVRGRYLAGWRRAPARWELVAIAFTGSAAPPVDPPKELPLRLPPLSATGNAGRFVAADLAFAALAADSGAALAFERWAAPTAILPGSILAIGPAAIAKAIGSGVPASWRWQPVLAWSSSAGDLGFTVGEAVITPKNGSPSYSKYLTAWRRLADGSVRYIADGGNPRPPTP
jgi:ketosteroid isomerase-like protein